MHDLETRAGLPEGLRVLLRAYPRDIWDSHRNFDALTRFWLDRHLMFRDLLGRITADAEAFLDGRIEGRTEGRTHAARASRLTGLLLGELHGHHRIEDLQYFPVLSGLEQRLSAGFDLLDGDHHALDGHLHALAEDTNAALRALRSGADAGAAVGAVHARLGRFAGILERHLIDEEELVIPVILHHAPRF